MVCGDVLRRLDDVRRDVDAADQHVLALEEPDQLDRHARIAAFERDLADAAPGQRGKGLLILAPMLAEGRFPVGVGLDAVAVADVDGGRAGEPLGGPFEGGDAPVLDLAHVDVEGRLVELHHVDAERRELVRLLVQRRGEGVGERRAVAVMLVGDGVDDGHRTGQGELELAPGVGARRARFGPMDRALAVDRAGHGRDLGLVAVGADADRLPAVEIDAVEIGEKAVDEMDARLLAVADDVDSRILLFLHCEDRGVDLAGCERGALQLPGGPELFRFSEPRGLRQAAGDGGFEHGSS